MSSSRNPLTVDDLKAGDYVTYVGGIDHWRDKFTIGKSYKVYADRIGTNNNPIGSLYIYDDNDDLNEKPLLCYLNVYENRAKEITCFEKTI